MENIWFSALASTVLVSLISLIGIFILFFKTKNLHRLLLVLVNFSIGALLGNSFFHLIPEAYAHITSSSLVAWLIIGGFLIFFLIDQLLKSYHLHSVGKEKSVKTYGYLSLYADGIHNLTDGILIAVAWMTSTTLGFSTTLAIIMHETPQEISDFGILIKAGFSKKRALLYNFLAAATSVLGTVLTLWVGHQVKELTVYILPIAAGGFIYLGAGSLLPEVLKETNKRNFWIQFLFLFLGFLAMFYFSSNTTHYHH